MGERLPNRRTVWMHAVNASGVHHFARHIGLVIGTYMNPDAECLELSPSLQTIADDTGLSHGTVNNYLPILETAGLLAIEHRTGRRGNRYAGRIPVDVLSKLKEKQSTAWTVKGGNSPRFNGNNPPREPEQSTRWTRSTQKYPLEGASRVWRERQEPDRYHVADEGCRCEICLARGRAVPDAS
jgi:hypothetical protein